MHARAHPLGALYDAHHGMLNAILMPYVLKANQHAVAPRLEALARYLDLPATGPGAVLDWVLHLRETVGIPHTLAEIGIDEGQAERVGRMASEDPSGGTNPIIFTADDYSQLLRASIRGNL
ncbi:hypothetical protein G6F50_016391 [Rhizopus delemar]|uniref:Fe-containing alcohol dehydrogenase-like C-terminal domain-containing protein n=1 Tax=Rhizopus delemar TaxID=936053 RepID=A0A9P7C1S8_9FUNG|nr:hypothetical protein G6F50_016391 [Rhizopus delemar]